MPLGPCPRSGAFPFPFPLPCHTTLIPLPRSFVEYQRKQRMVVRLHREALTAMCNFWCGGRQCWG
jgi:hypothetical protein